MRRLPPDAGSRSEEPPANMGRDLSSSALLAGAGEGEGAACLAAGVPTAAAGAVGAPACIGTAVMRRGAGFDICSAAPAQG